MNTQIRTVLVVLLLVGSVVGPAGVASANSPEYNGSVKLNGQVSDGSTLDYDLGSTDGVENFSVDITGVDNTVTESASGSISSGGSASFDFVSDQPPTNEEITLSAPYTQRNPSTSGTISGSGSVSISPSASLSVSDAIVDLSNPQTPDRVFDVDNFGSDVTWDALDILTGWSSNRLAITGTNSWISWDSPAGTIERVEIDVHPLSDNDASSRVSVGSEQSETKEITGDGLYTMTFDGGDMPFDAPADPKLYIEAPKDDYVIDEARVYYKNPSSVSVDGQSISPTGSTTVPISSGSESIPIDVEHGASVDYDISWTETDGVADVSGTVGGSSISTSGPLTSPVTKSVDLSDGSNDVELSYSGESDALSYDVSYAETTETTDPSININGENTGYTGKLGSGETTSLSVDPSWITNGTNNVSVSLSKPSGGPASVADISYTHDTTGTIHTTTLNSTTWEESYNVTETYETDIRDTVVNLPFSENVIEIDSVRMRVNGGEWQYPPSWGLSGGNLGVEIGDVNTGDTVTVKARGRKVNVENGQIDVTKTTVEGDRLSTEFKIVSADTGFGIDVGRTSSGSNLHYLESSSWSSDETTKFDGSQTLQLPNAPTGGTATVTTAPIKVDPLAGDVYVEWASDATNTEPRFHVKPGDREGDTVSYAFTSGVTGTEYSLYSESEGIVRDSGTANSPVWFEDDDSQETFQILTESSSSIETGDGGGGGFFESPSSAVQGAAQQAAGIMPVVDPIWVVVLVVGLIGGAVAYTERRSPTGSTPIYRRPAVGLAVVVAGGLTVFLISPTTITGPLQTTLGAILPLAGILVLFGGAALVWSRRQNNNGGSGGSQSTTEQMVALVPLRRSNDEQTGDGATDDGWFK